MASMTTSVSSLRLLSARPSSSRVAFRSIRSTKTVCVARPSKATQRSAAASINEVEEQLKSLFVASAVVMAPLLADVSSAFAGEYGLLTGRSLSLLHPIVMAALFGTTLYTGYQGLQWRRTRTLPSEISALKALRPAANEEGVRPPSEYDSKIAELETERKTLIKEKYNEKHHVLGSSLLALGVTFSISGAVNTFLRTGKLFPGPHLWAGVAITIFWALAAALTPQMQKGNETARSLHIAFNTVGLGLFVWQIPTGLDIVYKVLEFTQFP